MGGGIGGGGYLKFPMIMYPNHPSCSSTPTLSGVGPCGTSSGEFGISGSLRTSDMGPKPSRGLSCFPYPEDPGQLVYFPT